MGFLGGPALALLAALSYGVSDFVGGVASRRVAALRVVLVSWPVTVVLLGAAAVVAGGPIYRAAVVLGLLSGISQALGVWWFYAALAEGPISVVSPLEGVLSAAVPVAVGVALGERPGLRAAVGIVLAMVAVVLVSRQATDEVAGPHRFTAKVAWLAIGGGVGFGLNFVLIHQAPVESQLWPLLFARVSGSALLIAVCAISHNLRLPSGTPLKLALTVAVLDTCANVAMLLALHASLLSLASVLISLYPAATVVLALVVLRERLTRWQLVGLALALLSVVMIAGR
jgi:uncharacterized membrane protein